MEQTLYNLLLQDARFLLGAEAEQASRMRELAESLEDETLRSLFAEHAEETDRQIDRLQEILSAAGEEGEGEVPGAVEGMIEDAEMVADMDLGQPVLDVALAAAARKMEHYEIACYQSAISIAEQLGLQEIVAPLRQSLEEEQRADQKIAAAALALIQGQVAAETEPSRG
jgi:ferritin-like metal-binding protein YciE